MSRRGLVIAALLLTGAAGCARESGTALDDLRARAIEGKAGERDLAWVVDYQNRLVHIDDVAHRTWSAGPPSRLVFRADVPRGGVFQAAAGIPEDQQSKGPVEFMVGVRENGRDTFVTTLLVDPAKPAHRRWVDLSADLSRFAGKDREIVLETKAFESDGDAWRAFWGSPVIAVGSAARAAEHPLVIVYLVDTLRADHTSAYGYARDTTPRLRRFAADGVLFETAIAHASWTKPSVASLFTSRLPSRHRAVQLRDPLDGGQVTLAEMLTAKGFRTGALVANSVVYAADSNFHQGFDVMEGLHGDDDRRSKLVNADVVVDRALRFIDSRRGLPTFVYVHTMDPHVPYQPPPPFDRMFEPHPKEGHWGIDPRTDFKEPDDRDRLIAQYDGDIAYGDREFGRFIDGLKARGLYDRALIVFLADHGEEFQEHGGWLHGRSVFDELIRVPLIAKFPAGRGAGTRVDQMVQVGDVLPTVLRALDLPVPDPPAIIGRPLQDVAFATGAPEPPAISEISHRGFVASGIRTSADKYIRRFAPQTDELFFDLRRDPGERENRIAEAGERVRKLRAAVETTMELTPFRTVVRSFGGPARLKVETAGWIEAVETAGFGLGDRAELSRNGRELTVTLARGSGRPRDVVFRARPVGVPVFLAGEWQGRALRGADVAIGVNGARPGGARVRLPEVEDETVQELFEPPPKIASGLVVYLQAVAGAKFTNLDAEAKERLCAMGYLSGPGCGR